MGSQEVIVVGKLRYPEWGIHWEKYVDIREAPRIEAQMGLDITTLEYQH